jgi:DNA primase
MATAEGRARFLANARPLWSALPEGALKRQLLGELAAAAHLPGDELAQLWNLPGAGRPRAWSRPPGTPSPSRPFNARSRRPPASSADHVLRILLLHSDWWDRLTAADHELLHALPGPHAEVCAWLERRLLDHGPAPWSAIAEALAESPWGELGNRLVPPDSLDDAVEFAELRSVVDRLWIERLKAEESELIAQAATDPAARERYREVHERRRRLERAP